MSFVLEQTSEGMNLVVTGDWSPKARETLLEGGADGLVLNYARGFRERDLKFVAGLPLRRLRVLARTIGDLAPVYGLSESLESLHVQTDPQAVIDVERLPLLRALSASWAQIQGSIRFAPHLQRLFILSYTEQDLTPLTAASGLVSVVMKDYPRVCSLDGVEDLPCLTQLGVHLAKRLQDISAVQRAGSPVLETLQLASCRKVPDIAAVSACTGLKFLDVSECGDIPSVAALTELAKLERLYLYGSTQVLDGDLGPIAGLPRLRDFRMQSRRSYSPSVKEIQAAIAGAGQDPQ
jgi:hypothetical protein